MSAEVVNSVVAGCDVVCSDVVQAVVASGVQTPLSKLSVSESANTETHDVSRLTKLCMALHGKPISELRDVTCHMGYGITQCYLLPNTSERAPP